MALQTAADDMGRGGGQELDAKLLQLIWEYKLSRKIRGIEFGNGNPVVENLGLTQSAKRASVTVLSRDQHKDEHTNA